EDRGHGDRRREPREALLPSLQSGEEGARPRKAADLVGILGPVRKTGRKLLNFDRRLGARFVAGADEAGRGGLAGPLVTAAVLSDYACLRDHKVRPLALLNDSKQLTAEERATLFRAVTGCASRIAVRIIPPGVIDSDGVHRSNLR